MSTDDTPAAAAPVDPFDGELAADSTDPAVADLLARTRAEYGRYTARASLTFGGALAFTPGSPVPAGHTHVHGCPPACGCGVGGWLDAGLLDVRDDARPGVHPGAG